MNSTVPRPNGNHVGKLARRSALILGCWTLVSLISITRHYMEEGGGSDSRPFWWVFLIWLTCYYSWALLTPAVFLVAKRWPFARSIGIGPMLRSVLIHIPLSLAFTGAALFLSHVLYDLLKYAAVSDLDVWLRHLSFTSFLKDFPLYWSTLVAANVLSSFKALREKERLAAHLELERSQLESSLRQAQLDALRMQLNPHFLFNTLQTISVLMMDDTASANRMLVRLSDLLRSTLRTSVSSLKPLGEEIAFLRAYLEIEQIRFADRLCVQWDLRPGTEFALIPTLLLQPLVENSVRHGIARLSTRGSITITAAAAEDSLLLSVADTGPGISEENDNVFGHGIGLTNTRKRLKQLYPDHRMEIIAGPQGGFEVQIEIPLLLQAAETHDEALAR
jgi:two-component system, LytTR family, sensor kinase